MTPLCCAIIQIDLNVRMLSNIIEKGREKQQVVKRIRPSNVWGSSPLCNLRITIIASGSSPIIDNSGKKTTARALCNKRITVICSSMLNNFKNMYKSLKGYT